MKIALIVRKYQTSGGTERFTYNLSKYLAELGHEITIVCNKINIARPHSNIKFIKIPNIFSINRTIKTIFFNYMVNKKVNLNDFDIVQGCGKITKQDIYRAGGGFHKLYLKFQKKRNNMTLYDRIIINLEKKIYNPNNTKYIISVSNFIKDEILKEYNFPQDRIFTLHNFVDTNLFKPNNLTNYSKSQNSSILNIIFVANDFKLKGLENLIIALKYIPNAELNVVGNDNIKPFVKLAKFNNVNNRIFFHGEKKDNALIALYQKADILIHPSYFDTFAFVCLEALSCGIPVIISRNAGASEIISNFKDGIIIDSPENIKAIIESIKFFNNPAKLKTAKFYARKKALLYSIENYTQKLLEIYKQVRKEKFNV